MWLISRKKYDYQTEQLERALKAGEAIAGKLSSAEDEIREKNKLINSTERQTILADLELALNLMQAYQRALSIVSASDPNIIKANALLEKYGKTGDPNATILGAQPKGKTNSEAIKGRIDEARGEFVFDSTSSESRWAQEEEYYGDEAYGTATVRVEAVPIDEGDDKEPGYTRARIRFVDVSEEEPPLLAEAKATTEEASLEPSPVPTRRGPNTA